MSVLLTEKIGCLENAGAPKNPNCLGHLAGIGGDLRKPTRNGRLYNQELWEKVMASDDFKEMMETKTCFCEANHPTDRIDTDIREVCAVLTNMEIREDEGILWVEFDILDTPQGRILKSLVDYGCKIGVSSRGLGDEIQRNGETIIDPDTYSYYGHDMVVQPAVKAARPDVVESKARAKVTDVFKKEIENATTQSELVGLKRLAESVNMPNLDSIKESIDNKLSNGSLNGNNISESLEDDLGRLAEENEHLKTQVENLKKANNIGAKRSKQLTETFECEAKTARRTLRKLEVQTERLERTNQDLNDELNQKEVQLERLERVNRRKTESLQQQLEDALKKISSLERKVDSLNESYNTVVNENDDLKDEIARLNESCDRSNSRVLELENEISNKSSELNSLYEENDLLSGEFEKVNSKQALTENKVQDVSNELNESKKQYSEILTKYLDAKCLSEGIDKTRALSMLNSNSTTKDIDMVVEKLADEKKRLNKLPIALNGTISAQLESYSGLNQEDAQTMKFLTGFK